MTVTDLPTRRFARGASRRALTYLPATALAIDLTLMVVVGLGAVVGRRTLTVFDTPADVTGSLVVAGPLMMMCWLLAIAVAGGYRDPVFGAGTEEYKRVLNAGLLAAGLVGIGCYLTKFPLSRGFFVLAFGIGIPVLLLGRLLFRRLVQTARRHGSLGQRVIIAGSTEHVDEIASVLSRETWLGYHVVGALTPAYEEEKETTGGVPVIGNADEAMSAVVDFDADVIFFAGGAMASGNQMRRQVWEMESLSVQVVVAPSVTDVSNDRIKVRPVGGLPLMHLDSPTWSSASRWGKRTFDVVGSLALLAAFSPLLVFIVLRIKLHDGGPVLFRQSRSGRQGAEFACLKFRTMVVDAEDRLAELHRQENYLGGLFKMRDDPRVTMPGQWLRRYSLDELPQLFNVLRGEMSLVGPRPPLPLEVSRYDDDLTRRLHVRPGMTGLWQVSGRSDLSWSEAIRLDLYYVDNWSMLQDLAILARTFGAVMRSRGAY